jgi:hypothetical protein
MVISTQTDPRLLQEVGDLAEEDCTSSTSQSAVTIPKTAYMPDSGFHPNSDNPKYSETLAIPPSHGMEPAFPGKFLGLIILLLLPKFGYTELETL